ncbi:MAG: DUF4932 domain-containing protein [Candidatus Aenigmarchaeota archaeon]|nr:DUF4932 domain-containing protein [Candidatus Aenigmarchaeota archaeon]
MNHESIVTPDKNVFLAYTILNVIDPPIYNDHPLRKSTTKHFRKFEEKIFAGSKNIYLPNIEVYALTLNEAPNLSKRKGLTLSSHVKNMLIYPSDYLECLVDFYGNTDFEKFYQKILPEYKAICDELQDILDKEKIHKDLNDIWEIKKPFTKDVVIPMPLEETKSGSGPYIGDTAYQIIGPPFDYTNIESIIHEASHPRMDRFMTKKLVEEIKKKRYLFGHVLANPSYPPQYGKNWIACFEEHFIRAMQIAFFEIETRIPYMLEKEKGYHGFSFIREFYDEINKYKEGKKGSLQDVAFGVLERLDRTYKDKPVPKIYRDI